MPQFIIISGNGRSGSNRLLDAFDQSPNTICRSEPDGLKGGDFNNTEAPTLFAEDFTDAAQEKLNNALERASLRRGARDRHNQTEKHFFNALAPMTQHILGSRKARLALALLAPEFRKEEWPLPKLCYDEPAAAEATVVLKLAPPLWSVMLHNYRPDVKIVHNIRSPQAFLKSWYNRLIKSEIDIFFQKSLKRTNRIRQFYGLGPISEKATFENLFESEMWFWRYGNEMLLNKLGGSDRYMRITYEDFSDDKRRSVRRLFAFSGLELSEEILKAIEENKNTLFSEKHRLEIDSDMVDRVITRVLDRSTLSRIF